MTKTRPEHHVYQRAMTSRVGALQVIVKFRSLGSYQFGSGFVINDNCHLPLALTCNHVVRNKDTGKLGEEVLVRMVLHDGVQQLKASVLATDVVHDIALLCIPRLKSYTSRSVSMTLAPTDRKVGECGIAVGYCNPRRLLPAVACSRLPALSPGCIRDIGGKIIALDCICTQGMSGAPVVTSNGVTGMCDSISEDGKRTFAVSVERIRQVLTGWVNNGVVINQGLRGL